jgi:acetyltransferase-like isoleucine patch superfamily enzyme
LCGGGVIEVPAGLNSEFLSREVLETLGFASLGEDVLIHSTAVIVDCGKISLGARVRIDPFVIISNRGGVEFGNNVHIGGHSVLAGHAAIRFDDFVNISHYVGIYTSNEDTSGRTLSHPTVPSGDKTARTASISFGRHSAVGAGSLVFPGAKFAEGSVLGAMSRVGRPLRPWTTYAGIPARRMRERRRDVLVQEQDYLASLKELADASLRCRS